VVKGVDYDYDFGTMLTNDGLQKIFNIAKRLYEEFCDLLTKYHKLPQSQRNELAQLGIKDISYTDEYFKVIVEKTKEIGLFSDPKNFRVYTPYD